MSNDQDSIDIEKSKEAYENMFKRLNKEFDARVFKSLTRGKDDTER